MILVKHYRCCFVCLEVNKPKNSYFSRFQDIKRPACLIAKWGLFCSSYTESKYWRYPGTSVCYVGASKTKNNWVSDIFMSATEAFSSSTFSTKRSILLWFYLPLDYSIINLETPISVATLAFDFSKNKPLDISRSTKKFPVIIIINKPFYVASFWQAILLRKWRSPHYTRMPFIVLRC